MLLKISTLHDLKQIPTAYIVAREFEADEAVLLLDSMPSARGESAVVRGRREGAT